MKTILVQIGDPEWTMQALHLGCALARSNALTVTLLRLEPVTHPGYLGSGFGAVPPTAAEYHNLYEYADTAEDYGVEVRLLRMTYIGRVAAMVQASDEVDALALFAQLPETWVPGWRRFQTWDLRRRLMAHGRHVYTLHPQDDGGELVPVITLTPARSVVVK